MIDINPSRSDELTNIYITRKKYCLKLNLTFNLDVGVAVEPVVRRITGNLNGRSRQNNVFRNLLPVALSILFDTPDEQLYLLLRPIPFCTKILLMTTHSFNTPKNPSKTMTRRSKHTHTSHACRKN